MSMFNDVRSLLLSCPNDPNASRQLQQLIWTLSIIQSDPSALDKNKSSYLEMFDRIFAKKSDKIDLSRYRRFLNSIVNNPTVDTFEDNIGLLPKDVRSKWYLIDTIVPELTKMVKEHWNTVYILMEELHPLLENSDFELLLRILNNMNKQVAKSSFMNDVNGIMADFGIKLHSPNEVVPSALDFSAFNSKSKYINVSIIDQQKFIKLTTMSSRESLFYIWKTIGKHISSMLGLSETTWNLVGNIIQRYLPDTPSTLTSETVLEIFKEPKIKEYLGSYAEFVNDMLECYEENNYLRMSECISKFIMSNDFTRDYVRKQMSGTFKPQEPAKEEPKDLPNPLHDFMTAFGLNNKAEQDTNNAAFENPLLSVFGLTDKREQFVTAFGNKFKESLIKQTATDVNKLKEVLRNAHVYVDTATPPVDEKDPKEEVGTSTEDRTPSPVEDLKPRVHVFGHKSRKQSE